MYIYSVVGGGKVCEMMEKKALLKKLLVPRRNEQLETEKNPQRRAT
jgi:hypothetical protein